MKLELPIYWQSRRTKHLLFQLSPENEESWGKCCPLHWINCAHPVTRSWEEKKKKLTWLLSDEQNNWLWKWQQTERSPPKKTRRTQREVEEEEIWADSHTSDDFTLLTAVGLIVTSPKKRIYFHFRRDGHRRPRRPTRDDLYATEQQDSGGHYTSRSTAGLRRCWLLCVLRMPFW